MLHVENLSIKYPDKELPALKKLSFELPKGSICILSGDSGSGQTTLCLAIAGLLKHSRPEAHISGIIRWDGNLIDQEKFRQEIAITLENPYSQFSGLKHTVLEELAFGLEMRGFSLCEMKKRIQHAADIFGITNLLSRDPKTISGGEIQKAIIASSYVLMPELWILDKPLTELDPLSRYNVLQNLKKLANQYDITLIMTDEDHSRDLYQIASHLLTIKRETVKLSLNTKRNNNKSLDPPSFTSTISFTRTSINPSKENFASSASVQIQDLGFQYSSDQPMIFDNISVSVNRGDCLWITGPNGCGKTTLAKIIAGMLKFKKGEVRVNNIDPQTEPIWRLAHYVAFAFQNPDIQIFSTNVWDEVYFGPKTLGYSENKCKELTAYALNLSGLKDKVKKHPHELTRSERKRLGLAIAFAMDTPIIILDEPTQFQNLQDKQLVIEAINKALLKGKSILCITHDLSILYGKDFPLLPL